MNTVFGSDRPTKAKLEMQLATGDVYVVEFDYVMKMDVDASDFGGSLWRECAPSGNATISIHGRIKQSTLVTVPKKAANPVKSPKPPSVNASARAVRKATVKHAQLTASIFKAERALIEAKNKKAAIETELQKSREQLVAAAAGNR